MGFVKAMLQGANSAKDYQVQFGKNIDYVKEVLHPYLPAEWEPQAFIQLTWPHAHTDWAYMLEEVTACYLNIAREIVKRQTLLIVTPEPEHVKALLSANNIPAQDIVFFACDTNDTWARDHGFVTMLDCRTPQLLDFQFNGWGLKFAANKDNQINSRLYESGLIGGKYVDCRGFVLEGGSIESDGNGTLLTTTECLLSPNRNNPLLTRADIEQFLTKTFNLQRILWLDHGYLEGDDTDSHIDTLARLCPDDTIVYVQCTDPQDAHYKELLLMEEQLQGFKTLEDKPYRLIPLPWPSPIYVDGERLPATYANFLILNKAVLYPTYAQPDNDEAARKALQEAFPRREIVGIDCRALIRQHGSLHCVTMQYPLEVTLQKE